MVRLLIFTFVCSVLSVHSATVTVQPEETSTDSPLQNETMMSTMTVTEDQVKMESPVKIPEFLSLQEKNKKVVLGLMQALFVDKNLVDVDKFIGVEPENYIQHSPFLPDGSKYLKAAAKKWYESGPLDVQILRVAAEDDLVFVHFKVVNKYFMDVFGGKAVAVVDILRLENEKVVEHWDVIQKLPDNPVSKHPLF